MSIWLVALYLGVYVFGFVVSLLGALVLEFSTQQEGLSPKESGWLLGLWSLSVGVSCVGPWWLLSLVEYQASWIYLAPVTFGVGLSQAVAVTPWLSPMVMGWMSSEE